MIHNADGWLDRYMFEPATLPQNEGAKWLQIDLDHWVLDLLGNGRAEDMFYMYVKEDGNHYYLFLEQGLNRDPQLVYFIRINFNYSRFKRMMDALNIHGFVAD
jgi:hypothetical protein